MATKWPLKVEVDCPEPRLNKGRLVMGAYGLTWDKAFSDTTCFWDSPTQSFMPLPLPLSSAWETNFSGLYARLSLTDLSVSGTWRQYQVKGAGDYWIGLDDNLTYASNIYTTASWPANSAWYFGICNSDTTSNSNRVIMTITFGYVSATPDTVGIKLRFFANGGCQIFKNGILKGQYDQSDSNQTAGRNTPGTQKMTGQYHGIYILPHKRRELLVMTSWGLNFSHTFEDLDQNSTTNTILPAGYIRTFIEQKRPFFQMAPLRFSASCSAYSKPIKLRYAPPVGATFNSTVWYDRIGQATGGGGGLIYIVNTDGTPYTPDGIIDTIRVKVTLTSTDQIEALGVSLAEAWYQPTATTTANAPVDITPYLQNLSLAVDESGRTTLHMSGRRKRLADAGVQQVQITGDRPVRVALSNNATPTPTYTDIFRGTLAPPQIQYARADNTTDADMSALVFTGQDRSYDFTLQMFDSAVIYDNFTMESAVKDLVTNCGYATTDVTWNDTSGFVLPLSSDLAKGHANVCPQRGDNVQGVLSKIKTDYAANWFTAWQPTATGYKYVWSNPSSLSSTPSITLYHSTADAIAQGVSAGLMAKRVIRKFSAHYESPEANQIVVVGQDPRDASLIYAYGADTASMDPTTAPASRPYNWRGRPVMYVNSDPAITTPAAAAQAQTVLASRLMTGRILIEIETDILVNSTTNIPLWIGDVIKIMKPGGTVVRGIYRIVAIPNMSFERETNDAIVRRAVYRCVYLSAG